jgi:hypothetical protein
MKKLMKSRCYRGVCIFRSKKNNQNIIFVLTVLPVCYHPLFAAAARSFILNKKQK